MSKEYLDTELAALASLQPGWDGVDSVAIPPAAIADARAFLGALPRVPSGLDVSVSGDGTVHLFSDNEGGDGSNILFTGEGRIAFWARYDGRVAQATTSFSADAPTIPPELSAVLASMPA